MSLRMRVLALAVAGTATLGLGAAAAATASASTSVAKVSNGPTGPGEGGYYINDNGQTRIRDVQATTVVANTLEDLNGTAQPGGIGVELCNDNTGFAAQLGLEWPSGGSPVVEYNFTGNPSYGGTGDVLVANPAQSDQDPCVEGGLLNAGNGQKFANGITVKQGDVVHFEIFYDPAGRHFHTLKFLEQDVTQDLTRVQTVDIPAVNFYEAGIGVVSENQTLTGGAVNLINDFTGSYFNFYGACYGASRCYPRGIVQPAHWDLEMADFVNGSNQVTLTPGPLSAGNTSFAELEGSTSP